MQLVTPPSPPTLHLQEAQRIVGYVGFREIPGDACEVVCPCASIVHFIENVLVGWSMWRDMPKCVSGPSRAAASRGP